MVFDGFWGMDLWLSMGGPSIHNMAGLSQTMHVLGPVVLVVSIYLGIPPCVFVELECVCHLVYCFVESTMQRPILCGWWKWRVGVATCQFCVWQSL